MRQTNLILEGLASLIILWFAWQLYRAKQFTAFKKHLLNEVKPQVIEAIKEELIRTRSELWPNNEHHQAASIYYWTQYPARILQYALMHDILKKEVLTAQKKWRLCQHLFHVEQQYLAPDKPMRIEQITDEETSAKS